MFSESNSKTLLPDSIFSNHISNVFHLPTKCGCTYSWWLRLQRLRSRTILNWRTLMGCKRHILKKTFFPLRKDEETISEVGMVDWISKCEFIAGRIAQWFITLALESKGGRVAQWFITMALESKGQVYTFSTHTPSLYDVGEFLNLFELQFLHL